MKTNEAALMMGTRNLSIEATKMKICMGLMTKKKSIVEKGAMTQLFSREWTYMDPHFSH